MCGGTDDRLNATRSYTINYEDVYKQVRLVIATELEANYWNRY